jgi:hypothetical protein
VIWADHEAEYFCKPDWTTQISLRLLSNLAFWRKGRDRFDLHRIAAKRLVGRDLIDVGYAPDSDRIPRRSEVTRGAKGGSRDVNRSPDRRAAGMIPQWRGRASWLP